MELWQGDAALPISAASMGAPSSLAIFKDRGDALIEEQAAQGAVRPRWCRCAWPGRRRSAPRPAGVDRSVLLRIGIGVGGSGDPASERLSWLVRRGLGGRVGPGTQWVSWVALDDLLAVMVRAIDDEAMAGLYHVTSPNPITNAEMMATYRALLGRRFGLPAPAPSRSSVRSCWARILHSPSLAAAAFRPGWSARASSSLPRRSGRRRRKPLLGL